MNGDGQMDLNEFSVACKLITMKLKGFELPTALPPAILVIPQMGQIQMVPGHQVKTRIKVKQKIVNSINVFNFQPVQIMTSSIPSVMPQHQPPTMVGLPGNVNTYL